MQPLIGDALDDYFDPVAPHSGTGSVTTRADEAPRMYQRTKIGFVTDAEVELEGDDLGVR